ncbi:MAG: hypothetical protein IPP33_08440 [Flavobacteriales bacterium]|nr:hypothetical protein [Flavobacteriales bacterium]
MSKSSSLKISVFYRELRDQSRSGTLHGMACLIQDLRQLDFGTVKGFSLAYDLRRTGNIRLTASYTLQFADGTGSG